MISDKNSLFEAAKKQVILVDVPGSDEQIELSELSVKDRSDYFNYQKLNPGSFDYLAAFVLVRASAFLNDDDIESVTEQLSGEALNYMSTQVLKISGMLKTAHEDAEKN